MDFKSFLFICYVIVAVNGFLLNKKLKVKITKGEACQSTGAAVTYFSIKKISDDENSYSGNVTLPYDMTSDVKFQIDVSKQKPDGSWEDNLFNFQKNDPCNFLSTFLGEIWYAEQEKLGMERGKCPIKKGTYHDENVRLDLSTFDIPAMFAGNLKTKLQVMKDGNVDFCRIIYSTMF